jgi:hypothetical protein
MKLIILILLIIVSAGMITCTKYKSTRDDTKGDSSIYGRLFITDTLLGNGIAASVGNQTIYLSYGSQTDLAGNFLYSTLTDSAGYFSFTNLNEDSSYRLHFSDTVAGLVYAADTLLSKPGIDSLAFIAQPALKSSTGFRISFLDSTGGGAVPGIPVCVFTSETLSLSASKDTCAGSNYQLTSDNYGHISLFGLVPGTYYLYYHSNYSALSGSGLETLQVTNDSTILLYFYLP